MTETEKQKKQKREIEVEREGSSGYGGLKFVTSGNHSYYYIVLHTLHSQGNDKSTQGLLANFILGIHIKYKELQARM